MKLMRSMAHSYHCAEKLHFKKELHFKFELGTYENRTYFKQVRMTRNIFIYLSLYSESNKVHSWLTFQNEISQTCRWFLRPLVSQWHSSRSTKDSEQVRGRCQSWCFRFQQDNTKFRGVFTIRLEIRVKMFRNTIQFYVKFKYLLDISAIK
jgi:hypothetical protein